MDPIQGKIRVGICPLKGWAVFAAEELAQDEIIEENPVVPFSWRKSPEGPINDYRMEWTESEDCIALGACGLVNHSSSQPNARVINDLDRGVKVLVATRPIMVGEEILIKYKCELWFKEEEPAPNKKPRGK